MRATISIKNKKIEHEEKIPEYASKMVIFYRNEFGDLNFGMPHSEIDLKRQKVKKWQWLYKCNTGHIRLTTSHYKNSFEASTRCCVDTKNMIRPIPESEIEVEEED
jgi:hypothetical protein